MSFTTGTNSIDSLVSSSWNASAGQSASLTYSFLTRVPTSASVKDHTGFVAMNADQEAGAKVAMDAWASVANITFAEVVSGGDIQLGTNDQGDESSGYAYLPNGTDNTALFLNNQDTFNFSFVPGAYGLSVLIHELGHTLGLKHPGNYNSTGGEVDGPFLPDAYDNRDYSVMAYDNGPGYKLDHKYSVTPMLYDIQAIQYLYGANMSYHTGADTYSFAKTAALQCIWDAGGSDTFDFSTCRDATVINLNAGTFSSTAPGYNNISIAYNVTIERAIAGSGGSIIYTNDVGNTIVGGAGNDVIHEGAGGDSITGGGGADTVIFTRASSAYALSGTLAALTVSGDGVDTLAGIATLQFSDLSIKLADYSLLAGTSGNDMFTASAGNQLISGGAGIDLLMVDRARSNYQLAADGASFTLVDVTGSGGADLLSGVERVEFADGHGLALDLNGEAGQLYRLYEAMFKRSPDDLGMGFWLYRMDHGQGLASIAKGFINSPEFVRTYGENVSDSLFVTSLYHNVLNREPDTAGFAVQLNALNNGMSREQLLVNFSESAENIEVIGHVITAGVSYTPWVI